ncbi:MAG: DeoR/GlpR transcriptional regulator [Firmicutes bacterium]|nr:DeoR/GlpR transcriptional regulator [Bacillota bacterium]
MLLAPERRAEIVRLIELKGSVRVSELCSQFGVTEETIRRDLDALEKQGLLERTYGGAVSPKRIAHESPYYGRELQNKAEKEAIARAIAGMISDRETVLLDASSTSLYVARALAAHKQRLTVMTNSLVITHELSRARGSFTVMCTGGTLRETSLSFVGPHAERALLDYHVDTAIISCKGFHAERGFTDSNDLEVEIKKLMLRSANRVIAAVDSSKWGYVGFAVIGPATSAQIIVTDSNVDGEQVAAVKRHGVEVIVAPLSD